MRIGAMLIAWSVGAAEASTVEPREYWWYWDRPADVLPAPAPGVGVALVVEHVLLSGDQVVVRHRRSALPLPQGVVVMPVVHVEVDPARPFAGIAAQRAALVTLFVDTAQRSPSAWVQLDFEARLSQRAFWQQAVVDIRAALPDEVRLSVTALASWCYGDRWLADVPADEIVPMYFRLGRARADLIRRSAGGPAEPRCATAHGVADDEPAWPVALPGRRFVFLGRQNRPTIHLQRGVLP